MNKLKLEITLNGELYVEHFESTYNAKELSNVLQPHKFLYIENPNSISMYNIDHIDVLKIIQE